MLISRLILLLCLTTLAWANIGTVTAIRGDVKITRGVALYQAHKDLNIETKDTFFTARNGSMQITFSDKTVITLGKNSVFKVDEYLYSEKNRKKNKVAFKFRKGFFKSITGRIGKLAPKKFKITTKNATIGVRGTEITGTSNGEEEDIVCTYGEIIVTSKSSKKSYIAKANEHVKIKLDPRVEYIIAEPADILVQEQFRRGLKKADDKDVIKHLKSEMSIVLRPEVKKEMLKKGIVVKDDTPIMRKDTIFAAKVIKTVEHEEIEENFLVDTPSFRTQPEIREEIEGMTQEEIDAIKAAERLEADEAERARIEKAQRFKTAEKERVTKQQSRLEKKWNQYKPKSPAVVPKKKVTSKKEVLKSKINQMDQILDNMQDRF